MSAPAITTPRPSLNLSQTVWRKLREIQQPGWYGRLTLVVRDGKIVFVETTVSEDAR